MNVNANIDELELLRNRVAELEVAEAELHKAQRGQSEAEQRLRAFFECAPEAIVMLDVDTGRFIDVNPIGERLFGLPRQELIELGPLEMSPPCQPDGTLSSEVAARHIQEALAGEIPAFEWWHRNAKGELFPCQVRLIRMAWGDRNVIRGSIAEIGDRKQLELCERGRSQVLVQIANGESLHTVLHTLVKTIEDLLPGMACSVLILDPETNCLHHGAGPRLPQFYRDAVDGLKIGAEVGSCGTAAYLKQRVIVADVLSHPYWAAFRQLAEQANLKACWSEPILSLNSKVLGTFAMYFREPREPARVELSIIEIAAQLAGIAIEHDLTRKMRQELNESLERRVAERTRDLAEANKELERSNDELRQFAYIASHDLQEPIRMVTNFGQLLQAGSYKGLEEADEWLDFVVEGGRRMQALVNDLLDYSRIEHQARPYQSVKVADIIEEVVANLRSSIEDTGARITCDELPTVVADRPQIVQLLQHLLSNGIKFHDKQPPQVHISAERNDNDWVISVRDHGIGIPPQYLERVFDFFKRLQSRDRFPGTGIGLSICRRVVERHGGRIWAESNLGEGTTFYFTLPLRDLR